jgi:hypothetical protein
VEGLMVADLVYIEMLGGGYVGGQQAKTIPNFDKKKS